MFWIGCHLSASKGFLHMGEEALSIGANTFQFFTRNPRGGQAKALNPADVEAYRVFTAGHDWGKVVAHAPYTLNPCAAEGRTREFAHEVLVDDLDRMEAIPGNYYNLHPGSHVGQGIDAGIERIADQLNQVLQPRQTTVVLLETMAGKGSEVGSRFEELRAILDRISYGEKMGVCLDTCHVYDAGYDIVNHLDDVLEEFDRIIGLSKLRAVHLNDSKNPYSSHKDRHEKLAQGTLGMEAIQRIVSHPQLHHLPFLLETPNDLEGYAEEIRLLRQIAQESVGNGRN